MSTVTITFFRAAGHLTDLSGAPVMDLADPLLGNEHITSVAGSTASTGTSPHPINEGFVRVANNGGDLIAVRSGINPTAVATDPKVFPNTQEDFAVRPGHKIAVINA